MLKTNYQFMTEWTFEHADIQEIYDILIDSSAYVDWWYGYIQKSEGILSGLENRVGAIAQVKVVTPRFRLSFEYTMEVVEADPPHSFAFRFYGDLHGTGDWQLQQIGSTTRATYLWNVDLHKLYLLLLSPFLHSVYRQEYDLVMAVGYERVKGLLEGRRGGGE